MIKLKNINKTFKVAKRNAGFGQAMKSFFKKDYTLIKALDDVSFTINDGEMVGYIGPNGAGKSSTIKIMSGILTPDSGECKINGRTPWRERIAHVRELGVVFGQRSQLWWDVPVIDSFELIRDIYNVDKTIFKRNLNELCERLDIFDIVKTPTRLLSLGQRMRCEIVASLLHDPKILFLDEPTIGLDAVSKIAVRDFIKQINHERKTTVILTTHDMQDIEALTNRILLIGDGKILLDGGLDELKKRNSSLHTLAIDFVGNLVLENANFTILKLLDGHIEIELNTNKTSVSEVISILSNQVEIKDISIKGTTTEEMVVSLYKEFHI